MKEFFAKLMSWNSGRNRNWEKEKMRIQTRINSQMENLTNERQRMEQAHLRNHQHEVSPAERLHEINERSPISVETHDKAA